MAKSHWRFFLLRWHRRLGVTSALFVLLLAITGVMLNHGHGLGLDSIPLQNRWLRAHYGLPVANEGAAASGLVQNLPAGELKAVDGKLRLNGKPLGDCPQLVGIVEQAGQVLAVCSNRLLLLTPEGELIDQADSLRGIPQGLSAVASADGKVLLREGERSFSVNLGDLSVSPTTPGGKVAWAQAAGPAETADISWERVLLDLHSGRLFGHYGPWLMDFMAGLFAVLAVSGLIMARRRHHRA